MGMRVRAGCAIRAQHSCGAKCREEFFDAARVQTAILSDVTQAHAYEGARQGLTNTRTSSLRAAWRSISPVISRVSRSSHASAAESAAPP
jgi:hypothetical protein